jgi:hypothetical protein
MIHPTGTFDYVAIAPENPLSDKWQLYPREQPQIRIRNTRLVGYCPTLLIAEFGLRPDTKDWERLPRVLLSRVTLTADRREFASTATCSFFLDSSLVARLLPGDRVYLSRNLAASMGISAFREDRLLFAIGAVMSVPLGDYIKVDVPKSLIDAEKIIANEYPGFSFPDYPLGVHVGNQQELHYRGRFDMDEYEGFIWHGLSIAPDSPSECISICHKSFPVVAANASAQIILVRIEMVSW